MLSKIAPDDSEDPTKLTTFQLEFTKARLRAPSNYKQFAIKTVYVTANGFIFKDERAKQKWARGKGAGLSDVELTKQPFLKAYKKLAQTTNETLDSKGRKVRRVSAEAIRNELKRTGHLELDDNGQITGTARSNLRRAKSELLTGGSFVEENGMIFLDPDPVF